MWNAQRLLSRSVWTLTNNINSTRTSKLKKQGPSSRCRCYSGNNNKATSRIIITCRLEAANREHGHADRRFFSNDTSEDPHKLFKVQLEELEAERKMVFGDTPPVDGNFQKQQQQQGGDGLLSEANRHARMEAELMKSSSSNNSHSTILETHVEKEEDDDTSEPALTPEEMEELHQNREAIFQFSEDEKQAWGNSNFGQKVLSKDLMDEINEARRRQENEQYQQQQQQSQAESFHTEQKIVVSSTSSSSSSSKGDHRHHHESFSHVTEDGTSVHMVDVGHKEVTTRMAKAQTKVILPDDVLEAFASSKEELVGPKGPIFATAKLAGIMAAKKTSDLIPLCHPLPLDQVKIDIRLVNKNQVVIDCTCRVTHKTGVEMEALTGSTVAALTVYDMVKAVSHQVEITDTRLISKTGGKRTVANDDD